MYKRQITEFLGETKHYLRTFLRQRGVTTDGHETQKELAEKCFWTEKLGLGRKFSDDEAAQDILLARSDKLILDGGLVKLPRPESLAGAAHNPWEDTLASLPDVSRAQMEAYINSVGRKLGCPNSGGKTLGLGKGLFLSGHVKDVQFHGISPNINYCFLRAKEAPEKRVLVLGLDGAGKSSLLQHMNSGDSASALKPTNGFSVISIQNEGVALNIWEVGGAEGVRSYWENFVQGTELLVFVVDATDEAKLVDAREELGKLLADPRLRGVPLIVVANKQDQPGAKTGLEVVESLGVDAESVDTELHILETHTAEDSASLEEIERLKGLMRTLWPRE